MSVFVLNFQLLTLSNLIVELMNPVTIFYNFTIFGFYPWKIPDFFLLGESPVQPDKIVTMSIGFLLVNKD